MRRLFLLISLMGAVVFGQVPVGTPITNVAQLSYEDASDTTLTASSDTVTTVVSEGYLLHFAKSAEATIVLPGDTLTYHLLISNTGNIPSPDYTVVDTIPEQFAFLASSLTADVSGTIVSWDLPALDAGADLDITLDVILNDGTPAELELANTAWLQVPGDPGIQTDPAVIVVGADVDLQLIKTVSDSIAEPGDTLLYTLSLRNTGSTTSTATILRDALPEYLIFVSASEGGTETDGIVTWQLGDMMPGDSLVHTVTAAVHANAPPNTTVLNVASVTDAEGSEEISTAATLLNPWVIPITKTAQPGEYAFGDTVTFSIGLFNESLDHVHAVTITDTLPHPLQFVSASHDATVEDNVVTWFLGSVQPGSFVSLSLDASVGSLAEATPEVTNTAYVTTANAGANSDTHTVAIAAFPELWLEKQAPALVNAGELLSYDLVIGNQGATRATQIVVVDSLPDMLDFADASEGYSYDEIAHVVSWNIDTLASAASDTVTVQTRVRFPIVNGTVLTNTAHAVSVEGSATSDDVSTQILSAPDLLVELTGEALTIPGDTISYTINYSNSGTETATEVFLIDSLSIFQSFLEASEGGFYLGSQHAIVWSITDLAPGDTGSVSFTTLVRDDCARGTEIENQAGLTCAEGTTGSAVTTTLVRAPEITLSLEIDTAFVSPGDVFNYLISFANVGDTLATDVVLIDSLSQWVDFRSASEGAEYDSVEHVVRWYIGDLEPEGSGDGPQNIRKFFDKEIRQAPLRDIQEHVYTVEVNAVDVIPNGTEIENIAAILSGDGLAAAAAAAAANSVQSGPELSLIKTAEIEVFPGDTIHYQLSYANLGTDRATGVVIRDTLDNRIEFLSATGDYTFNELNYTFTWDLGDLDVNGSGSFEIVAMTPDNLGYGEIIRNAAWIESNELDPEMAEATTANILPMSINLSADPTLILGNGISTSTLTAEVLTFLGNPAPDGVNVQFFTELGHIPDTLINVPTENGFAFSTLVSDTVVNEPVTSIPWARALFSPTEYAEDTTAVVFIIGAFEGCIYNLQGEPVEDVRVELHSLTTGAFAGMDSTDAVGCYLIPILQDDLYEITYTLYDENGDPYTNTQTMEIAAPDSGSVVTNLNSVSGWLHDGVTGEAITEDSVMVIIVGETDTTGLGKTGEGAEFFSDTTFTDSLGKYFFTNLQPGEYELIAVYNGIQSYGTGSLNVNLSMPGVYVVSANVELRQSPFYIYKTVDKIEASVGDTLNYNIWFGTNGVDLLDSMFLVDFMPTGVQMIPSTLTLPTGLVYDAFGSDSTEFRFTRNQLMHTDSLEMSFQAVITRNANNGWMENIAIISNGTDSSRTDNDGRSNALTKIIRPFLGIEKDAGRRVIELGDVLTYTVKVINNSEDDPVHNFSFEDVLPFGFKYRRGTSVLNGEKLDIEPLLQEGPGKRIVLTWTFPDTLYAGETLELKYRAIAGLNSREGTNVNEVWARAVTLLNEYPVHSDVAEAEVLLKPGIFSDRGLIIGKVYFDENHNGFHDQNERTVEGVELIMETGARIRTDEYGKFSLQSVSAAMHVLRINERTLPAQTVVINDSPDYLGDTRSRIVRVAAGGIAKVSIALDTEILPAVVSGQLFYDQNGNSVLDSDESVQGDAMIILSDSVVTRVTAEGSFEFIDLPLGPQFLRVDASSLPAYAAIADSVADSLYTGTGRWEFTMRSGDSLHINIPLQKQDIYAAFSKESELRMDTEMITKEFRLLAYKPWTSIIRLGFDPGSATLNFEIYPELRRVADLLEWQTQINLDIVGHTDNIPTRSSGFKDNQELSESRANAIRTYLIDEAGIAPSRLLAVGKGDTEPVADNETAEGRALNRRVEMTFYNANTEDDDYNQLQFRYNMDYTGEIEASEVRFHQLLPPGFAVKFGSSRLNEEELEPSASRKGRDEWMLGNWQKKTSKHLDIAMWPKHFEDVQNTGTVTSFLEYIDEDGESVYTDSLKTEITTVVASLSFNLILEGTQFSSGSAELRESALPALRKLGDFMTWQPDIQIVIEGFTDNMGSLEYNMMLSEWRANSVKQFLVDNYPVNPDKIFTRGLGPHYPVGDNEERLGRQANRRVEILVNAEVGEVALMELELKKEDLVHKEVRPHLPFEVADDIPLRLPGGQANHLITNLKFPAFPQADLIVISQTLLEDLYYEEGQASTQRFHHNLQPGSINFKQHSVVVVPEGVEGEQQILLEVQFFRQGESISDVIQKELKVYIK